MAMLQRYTQSQRLQQKADPQLLMTNRILQMSTMELQQCLVQELSENPALESVDDDGCQQCEIPGPQCLMCPYSPLRATKDSADRKTAQPLTEEDIDPLARVESQLTLREHLLTQLAAAGTPEEQTVGNYLIANIDNDGYLRCDVEETARSLKVPAERVEQVIELIQGFDPAGVGARSLQECLLIQARAAGEGAPAHLERILAEFWKELTSSKLREIARKLKADPAVVEHTVAWLRKNLSPYPGTQFRPSWEKSGHRSSQTVKPDVYVLINGEDELELEVPSEDGPAMQVNPQYARLWQQIRDCPDAYSAAEKKHVREYLLRAQMFLKSLEDRTSILRQVAECLISEQERYFRTEREEDMMPLTQSQLASFLHVHESTVSRAVAEKFLQLPSGRMVPLSYFFDRALSHRKLVANVVASENPAAPYSDQEIADILRRQGVTIARRTVMKYREELNILSSRQRARTSA